MGVTSRLCLVTVEIPPEPENWLEKTVRLGGRNEIHLGSLTIRGKLKSLERVPAKELWQLCRPKVLLRCDLGGPPLAQKLWDAYRKEVPPDVLGNFAPNNLSVAVGKQKIHYLAGHRVRVRQVGFEFGLWGYGSPQQTVKFLGMAVQVSAFKQLRKRLEKLIGPTEFAFMVCN